MYVRGPLGFTPIGVGTEQARHRSSDSYVSMSLLLPLRRSLRPHAYYPKLRSVLGESPVAGTYSGFWKMEELWDEHEQWSCVDQAGQFGLFTPIRYVSWRYVGPPMGQALLSEDEIKLLPQVFARAGLDPKFEPSSQQVASALANFSIFLRTRTRRLIEAPADDLARQALLSAVSQELSEWDGEVVGEAEENSFATGTLRLCARVDRSAGRIRLTLRCKSASLAPDEDLTFRPASGSVSFIPDSLICYEDDGGQGWSTPLEHSNGVPFDPAMADWLEGFEVVDSFQGFKAILPRGPIRVLTSAEDLGFSGYLEAGRIREDRSFLLLVHLNVATGVQAWGIACCEGWAELSLAGLPSGWKAFAGSRVLDDGPVKMIFPVLGLPRKSKMNIVGGFKNWKE